MLWGHILKEQGINKFITDLYDEPFEAWPYGPVVRGLYFEHKVRGRSKLNGEPDYNADLAGLDDYIRRFLGVPVRELVDEESHEHALWKENVSKIMLHQKVEYRAGEKRHSGMHLSIEDRSAKKENSKRVKRTISSEGL